MPENFSQSPKTSKTYAFIDSQNLNLETQKNGWKVDFKKFRVFLKQKYKVEKAFLFLGYIPENKNLYDSLQKWGYEIIFKPVVKYGNGKSIKGNVDAELVLHSAQIEYKNYDQAIIISNDGDFYCLIEFLEQQKKLSKVLTPSTRYSSLLRKFSRFITPIDLFRKKVEYTKGEAFPQYG